MIEYIILFPIVVICLVVYLVYRRLARLYRKVVKPAVKKQAPPKLDDLVKRLKSNKPCPTIHNVIEISRNDPCLCGSGKKFKHCHGAEVI